MENEVSAPLDNTRYENEKKKHNILGPEDIGLSDSPKRNKNSNIPNMNQSKEQANQFTFRELLTQNLKYE